MKKRGGKKRTAIVPRTVLGVALAGVVPLCVTACGNQVISLDAGAYDMSGDRVVSLDAGTYDAGSPDHGVIGLDAGTFDAGAPDHGVISLDAGAFDAGATDLGSFDS